MEKRLLIILFLLIGLVGTTFSQQLKGKTLTAGPKSDKFTFISNKKLIWTNSLNDEGAVIKKKLKYDYRNKILRITLYWKIDGFIEAETYRLFYDEEHNFFIDREVDLIWYFAE